MKLLILGLNYAPEPTGIAVYTSGMAEFLSAAGHEVEVIAGQPYYPAWRIMPGHNAWTYSRRRESGVDVTRVPHYIPRRPSGLRRVTHHASFAAAASPPLLARALTTRPDVIMTIAPSLAAAPMASLAARLCGAKCWLHIQDFEVDAASAMGHFVDKGGRAALAIGFERAVLTRFDRVSTISPAMCQKLATKGVSPNRIFELRNWADPAIRPLTAPSIYCDDWRIETPYVALYSGTLADKQGLDIILEAARLLRHRSDLTFIICGDGARRGALAAKATALPNLRLLPLAPRERLGDLLGLATLHLLPQRADAADLMLPSKLANMLASGRPVIATAAPGTSLAREVEACGIATPPGNATAFAAAITALIDDPARHAALAVSAYRRAAERWNRDHILTRLEADLLALTAMSPRPAEQPA